MGTKSKHPEAALLEYVNGERDETSSAIEEHLAICSNCSVITAVLQTLKREAAGPAFDKSGHHPGVGELASFFYDRPDKSFQPDIAAHVALCAECRNALAVYAQAERYSAAYSSAPAKAEAAVPIATWKMIKDWEEKDFPGLRSDSETITGETLNKLLQVLREHKDELETARATRPSSIESGELVPVIVVGRKAEFRGIEVFERKSLEGVETLMHPEESERFDSKPVHAVVDLGRGDYQVVSEKVSRSSVRLKYEIESEEPQHTDYFIVED